MITTLTERSPASVGDDCGLAAVGCDPQDATVLETRPQLAGGVGDEIGVDWNRFELEQFLEMLQRRGTFDPGEDNSVVARAFQDHLSDVYAWLNGKPYVKVNRVQYHAVLREPKATAEAVAEFLELPLDVEAMTGQVDGSLYRQRRK